MNNLIIFAGYPATGKTYIINKIKNNYKNIYSLSIDDIEEYFYDNYGFYNLNEKRELYDLSFEIFYLKLRKYMKENKDIVIDYPFSYLQYGNLKELITKYGYNPITIRLTGDLKTIYKRRVARDLDPNRKAGHLLNEYNSNMKIDEGIRKENLISYEEFVSHCKFREYDQFKLGALLVEDVSDKYADIDKITRFLNLEMRKNDDNR